MSLGFIFVKLAWKLWIYLHNL